MTVRVRQSEAELGEAVIAWLQDLRLDVYQEVELRHTNGRCDVVAVADARWVWTIELKTRFGLEVLAQAERWIRMGYAHRSSIAIPSPTASDAFALGLRVASTLGVGVLIVSGASVREMTPARRFRAPRAGALLATLEDEHKTAAKAGTSGGGYWTPFRRTCRDVAAFVRENPGATLKQTIDGIDHHYATDASARAHMVGWIERGMVEEVEIRRDDAGKITLWPNPKPLPGQVKL